MKLSQLSERLRIYSAWVLASEGMWTQAIVCVRSINDDPTRDTATTCVLSIPGPQADKAPLMRDIMEMRPDVSVANRAIVIGKAACALRFAGDAAGAEELDRVAHEMWSAGQHAGGVAESPGPLIAMWKLLGVLRDTVKESINRKDMRRRFSDALVAMRFSDMEVLDELFAYGIEDCFLTDVKLATIRALAVHLWSANIPDEDRDLDLYKLGVSAFGTPGGEVLAISIFRGVVDVDLRNEAFSLMAPSLARAGKNSDAGRCVGEITDAAERCVTAERISWEEIARVLPSYPWGVPEYPPLPGSQDVTNGPAMFWQE